MPRPLTKSPPINFRVDLDQWAQLQRLAERNSVTPSQMAQTIVLNHLADQATPTQLADVLARARAHGKTTSPPASVTQLTPDRRAQRGRRISRTPHVEAP